MNLNYLKMYESDDLEDDDADVIENLLSILRKFIRNAGYEPYVFYEDEAIAIQFILNKSETMPSLMKVMNLLHKLQSDIPIQYECDFELAETTTDDPLVTALFWYNESGSTRRPSKKDDDDDVLDVDKALRDYPF